MENHIENRQNGKGKPSHLVTENEALRDQVAALTAERQAAVDKLAKLAATGQQYQESQARFGTLFEQSRLGNKSIAPDLCIMKVNQALVAMLGYAKSEIEGTRIVEYARANYVKHGRNCRMVCGTATFLPRGYGAGEASTLADASPGGEARPGPEKQKTPWEGFWSDVWGGIKLFLR